MSAGIPQVDLRAQFESLRGELMAAVEDVLQSGTLFLGPQTQRFEVEYAAYCGTAFAVAVSNGTDALHLALRAAGVGEGDEVVTVANTFIATLEAIVHAGARPVLVDIDPETFTLDVGQIERSITPRTRAIIPVHLFGRLAAMDEVLAVAKRYGLTVIEDASQSQGAADAHGRVAGSMGEIGCFSFYYAKNLGAYGEAGAVTTSDPEIARRLKLLRSHGEESRYQHELLGYNARPDELQCALLRVKLPHLDAWNERRRQLAANYAELLRGLPLELPELIASRAHVYHQYVVRTRERDAIREELVARGIGTGIHYPIPTHLQPACTFLGYHAGDFPVTERAAATMLSLPMYPELTRQQQEMVAKALIAALEAPVA